MRDAISLLLENLSNRNFKFMSYYSNKKGGSSEHVSIKDKAISKFSELIITRMEQIEAGEWKQGWIPGNVAGVPENIENGKLSGSNVFTLLLDTMFKGYSMPVYMTCNQANNLGVRINKGAESIPVIFWNVSYKDANGKSVKSDDYALMTEKEKEGITATPFLTGYNEFNIDQTNFKEVAPEKYEELKKRFRAPDIPDIEGMYTNAAIDRMLERQEWVCPVKYDKLSSGASFSPSKDCITIPMKHQFKVSHSPEEIYKDGMEYYSTFIHEAVHSTGTEDRLNRVKGDRFGDKKYGYEECIAELSAAVVGKTLGFEKRILDNNMQYVKGWISAIKEKPGVVINMVGDIGKASNMVLEKINEQKIALGEKPIFGKESILSDEEVQEVQARSSVKRIVGFIVERANDPSPHASFTKAQSYVINKYLDGFVNQGERIKEADRLWSLAERHPDMKKACSEWKDETKEEFNGIVNGILNENVSAGMRR